MACVAIVLRSVVPLFNELLCTRSCSAGVGCQPCPLLDGRPFDGCDLIRLAYREAVVRGEIRFLAPGARIDDGGVLVSRGAA